MPESSFPSRARPREPMFFVPTVVVALTATLLGINAVVSALSDTAQDALLREFAFIPARLTLAIWPSRLEELHADPYVLALLGGGAKVWTLFTYALLHGSWTHVLVNSIWLVAFGPPIARRFGAVRFLLFFAMTAIAGALAHWAVSPTDVSPLIGASAADSGLMAAAARFIFQPGAPLSGRRDLSRLMQEAGEEPRVPSLLELLSQRRAIIFIAIWMATNFVFGAGAQTLGASEAPVAWIAHVGGFVAGLVAFPLFDRPARRREQV
ncbi:MAG: rhomboid family intramembrane serine protease [Hyphomicrobiales bacterium]|nr:rhomboid family intramembrane serine protease [Hyphomicrobiales bacterium]